MKSGREDSEFNTPQEMLARAAYLVFLATFAAGLIMTVAGVIAHELRLLMLGVAALAVAGLTREWLGRTGQFEAVDSAFNEFARGSPAVDSARVAELRQLLIARDELERKRGSPDFDPWAVLAVRHDIRAMLEKDPALKAVMRDDLGHAA